MTRGWLRRHRRQGTRRNMRTLVKFRQGEKFRDDMLKCWADLLPHRFQTQIVMTWQRLLSVFAELSNNSDPNAYLADLNIESREAETDYWSSSTLNIFPPLMNSFPKSSWKVQIFILPRIKEWRVLCMPAFKIVDYYFLFIFSIILEEEPQCSLWIAHLFVDSGLGSLRRAAWLPGLVTTHLASRQP